MTKFMQLSEALYLAIHAMILLARENRMLNIGQIAKTTGASEFHLSKVMQQLCKAGFVQSVRGPSGGFSLLKNAGEITLLELYEIIEGRLETEGCPFGRKTCPFSGCLLGGKLNRMSAEFRDYLKNSTLDHFREVK